MRCGVEGSQVSDEGDSHVFTFRVHGLRFCYKDVVGSLLFSFAARFLE